MRMQGSRPYLGLLVPDQAVVVDQSREVVYVVDAQGLVAQKPVELGPVVGGLRVIRAGLAPGDHVIIEGVQHARPGKPVSVRRGAIAPEAQTTAGVAAAATPAASATFVTGAP